MSDEIIAFAELHGLEEKLHVLQKAGHLIEADTNHRDIPAITKAELYALETEHSRKWNQPLTMYLCILATALGAIGQGWAQASINGANLYYPQLFHVGSSSMHDTLVVGFINSGIYLSNGLLGSWLVAPLNSKLGRRGAVFTGALISLLFNVLGSSAPSWRRLLLCRLCLGVGLGIVSSSLNVFAAECAPAAIRGGLSVAWQMFVAFGIFLGFWANMLIDDHPESSGPLRWRYMLLAPAISNLPLLLLIFACPESPSWYIKHASQYRRAFTSLYRLRNTELQAARELLLTYFQRKEIGTRPETSLLRKLPELFTIPRNRRATVAAWSTNLAQQACGINIIAFFSSSIFVEAHFSNHAAELASTIFGLVNTIGALPAIWLMDAAGRRTLLLLTLPPMAVCMGIAGLSFSISEEKASLRFGMITSMIYLFCLLYSPGKFPRAASTEASHQRMPITHIHRNGPRPTRIQRRGIPPLAPRTRRILIHGHHEHLCRHSLPDLSVAPLDAREHGQFSALRLPQRRRVVLGLFSRARDEAEDARRIG
jgi:MFS family permease